LLVIALVFAAQRDVIAETDGGPVLVRTYSECIYTLIYKEAQVAQTTTKIKATRVSILR
jgi:hypothetical protein